jgi:hypothetical protein
VQVCIYHGNQNEGFSVYYAVSKKEFQMRKRLFTNHKYDDLRVQPWITRRLIALAGCGLVVFLVLTMSACSPVSGTGDGSSTAPEAGATTGSLKPETPLEPMSTLPAVQTPSPGGLNDRLNRPQPSLPPGKDRFQATPSEAVTGEVPLELLSEIIADLANRLDIKPDAIAVARDEAVVWNDGSLGCAQPGLFYTQAQVDGYWVVLQVGENSYDYRATSKGYFTLCENPLPIDGTIDR